MEARGGEIQGSQYQHIGQHIYSEVIQPYLSVNTSQEHPLQSDVLQHQRNVQNILVNMNRSDKHQSIDR